MALLRFLLYLPLYFSVLAVFFRNRLRELVPPLVTSIMANFDQILREHFEYILKQRFKGYKNSE